MKTLQIAYERAVLGLGYTFIAFVGAAFPFILITSTRLIPTIILLFIYGAYFLKFTGKAEWPIKKLWLVFWLVLLLVRVDVTFIAKPGPPRLVPYVIGYPSDETRKQIKQGEVAWHGCTATLLEPLWVIVW